MNTMSIPGFTAETSVYETTQQYRSTGMQRSGRRNGVILATDPLMTCAPDLAEMCSTICDVLGGGMATNPNGTVSCY